MMQRPIVVILGRRSSSHSDGCVIRVRGKEDDIIAIVHSVGAVCSNDYICILKVAHV